MEDDRLDYLLSKLPGDPPPPDLAAHICQSIWAYQARRNRRVMQSKLAISVFLGLTGVWLAVPVLADAALRLNVPTSGVPILMEWYQIASLGSLAWPMSAAQSLVSLQAGISSGFGGSVWIGLIVLTLGSLLALDQILFRPRKEF